MNINKFLTITASLIALSLNIFSQDLSNNFVIDTNEYNLKPKFGIYGHYNIILNQAEFSKFSGLKSCCPDYGSTWGNGFDLGALFDFNIDDRLQLNIRAGYAHQGQLFSKQQIDTVIVDNHATNGVFEHRLDTKFGLITIEPGVSYLISPNFYSSLGFRLGFSSFSKFSQIEEIVVPSDRGTFTNGYRTRNAYQGEIPDINSLQMGINLGFSYQLPMNKKNSLWLVPELIYTFNFSPVVKDLTWNYHSIRAGLAIKYKQPIPPPPPPAAPIIPPFPQLPLPQAPPALMANVTAVEIDSLGNINPNFNIRIEDFISHNMRPLLNYVFFDENSSQLPTRYITLNSNELDKFNLKNLQNLNAIQTYYHVLNIIGKRLQDNPNANIELIGTNSNEGPEKNNKELSRQRALTVRDYLEKTWGIDPRRMPIKARNLPEKYTRNDEPGGNEENRRVEIISEDWAITEPVITVDTMRVLATSKVRFLPTTQSSAGIKEWKLSAIHDANEIKSFSGKGNVEPSLEWSLSDKDPNFPKSSGNIFFGLTVTDSLGQTVSSSKNKLPVEQLTIDRKRLERIRDKEFEYYSLILFDFGKTDLRSEHKKVVDFVKDRANSDAKIYIRGYTDNMGETDINKVISSKRAKAVAERLKLDKAEVMGIGEDELLYDNTLPEGRFYCRTVQIIIETPIEEK